MPPMFNERVQVFNKSDEAEETSKEVSLVWTPVAQMLTNFQPVVQTMVAQKSPNSAE